MALGLIVKTGRILTAKLLLGQAVDGITHCAIGDGDASFTDPQNPPAPDIGQTGLRNERARKRYYKRTFLKEDAEGALLVNGVRYLETGEETNTIGIFFRFDEAEANGIHPRIRLLRWRCAVRAKRHRGSRHGRRVPSGHQPDR